MVSLLTLSLGIGINTTVFTLYDSLTYRLLPVKAPDELLRVAQESNGIVQPTSLSYQEFEDLRNGMKAFAKITATSPTQTIMGELTPTSGIREGVKIQFVAGDYFDVLDINCKPGRALNTGDKAVAVLSHTFWIRRLKADPAIAGKVISLGALRLTVIGVAPQTFYGTDLPPRMPDIWLPLESQARILPGADWVHDPTAGVLHVLGRRNPGVSLRQVSDEVQQIGGVHVSRDSGKSWLTATEATAFQTNMGGFRGTGTIALILMGAVGLILLIGCVNLLNLTLSRNAARKREISLRMAIGASRRQIVQQLCVETLVLGVLAGAIGCALSVILCNWIRLNTVAALGRISQEVFGGFQLNLSPDWRVFVYTLALSIVAAALVGVWPALGATAIDLRSGLNKEGLRKGQRHVLLTAQIAACFVLLTGSGLLFRGTWQSRSANPGFRLDRILLMSADLTTVDSASNNRGAVLERILDQTRSLPEVASVALVDRPPFLGTGSAQFEDEAHRRLRCRFNRVSGSYFDTLNIPLLAGRSFSTAETEAAAAEVVVSQAAAQFYWPGQNPLGRRILIDSPSRLEFPRSSYTVIGVARVVRNTFLSKLDNYYLYFPKPTSDAGGWVLIRTRESPEAILPDVRNTLMKINQAVASHAYLISLEKGPVQIQKLMTELPGTVSLLLGLLALALASVGLYGVVMYMVAQRTRVIGIHLALGAQRLDVIGLVLGEGLRCVAKGALIGLAGAAGLSSLLAALVKAPDLPDLTYQAGVFDPTTFLLTLTVLAVSVAAACLLPVYRASQVDPVTALRND